MTAKSLLFSCSCQSPQLPTTFPLCPFILTSYPFLLLTEELIVQLIKNPPQFRRPEFLSWVEKICCRMDRWPTPVAQLVESACNVRDLDLIPGLGRSPGEGKGYPIQYSGLENSMDSPWVAKSPIGLSDFHFHFHSFLSLTEEFNFSIIVFYCIYPPVSILTASIFW